MNLTEAVEFVISLLKKSPAEQFEVFGSESEQIITEIFEGKVKNLEINSTTGLGIRLFHKKRPGYAYSEKFTVEALKEMVESALAKSQYLAELCIDLPEKKETVGIDLKLYNPKIEDIDFNKMKEIGLSLEEIAYSLDPRIVNVPYLALEKQISKAIFQNSKGVEYENKSSSFTAGLGVLAKEGESKKMGFSYKGGRAFNFSGKELALEAVERAVSLLQAKKITSGKYPVLLRNRVISQLFSIYLPVFYAEMAQKGKSRLIGKKGQKIASTGFFLYSDPHLPEEPGSYLFDGEGVLAQKVVVIEDGIFQNFLHNLESAFKEKENPTGNAQRNYIGKVSTRFANLVVPKGNYSLRELQNFFPKVLQIEKLEGSASCSFISGEISIGAQGFLVEKGEIVQKVDQITLSGNFFDLLNSCLALSDEYAQNFSSIKIPDFLTNALTVAG